MLDVRFTLKNGAQIRGHFDQANSLDDIFTPLTEWAHGDGEFEVMVKVSEIAAIEVTSVFV